MLSLKIKGKLLTLIISSIVLFSIIINVVVYYRFNSYIIDNSLNTNSNLSIQLVEEKCPGNWKTDGTNLYKGNTLINNDTGIVDSIKKATGAECTIFLKNKRIATTVKKNGVRAVGTTAMQSVADTVIQKGEKFIGIATVLNKPFATVYRPLRDKGGNVIGMFFLGISKDTINQQVQGTIYEIMIITVIVIAIITILLAFAVMKIILNPLQQIHAVMENASRGDLTCRVNINRNDEIGALSQNINKMIDSITNMIGNIKSKSTELYKFASVLSSTSSEISTSSDEVANSIQQNAVGVSEQAEDLAKTKSLLDDFNRALGSISNSLKTVEDSSDLTNKLSNDGNKNLIKLAASIDDIKESFENTLTKIDALNGHIKNIDEVAILIKSISDQTNLLSLNAAIEAARAGEAGKGFNIVANEIRHLAEQSKESTQSIAELVRTIIAGTQDIVADSNVIKDKLLLQSESVNNTTQSFDGILESLNQTKPHLNKTFADNNSANTAKEIIVEKISLASTVAEEISASTEEISASTQHMTTVAEQLYSASEKLQKMSAELVDDVKTFRV